RSAWARSVRATRRRCRPCWTPPSARPRWATRGCTRRPGKPRTPCSPGRGTPARERLQALARQTAARAAACRARADKARAWAEASRARVEREVTAGRQWLSDAKARTDRLVAGFCYDRQAHLDDAAYYAAAAEACQGAAAYWSGLGNGEWAGAYGR